MGKYVSQYISKQPRLGAARLLASLSAAHLSSTVSTPGAPTTPTHLGIHHLPFKNSQPDHSLDGAPPNKRQRVSIEDIPDEDVSLLAAGCSSPPVSTPQDPTDPPLPSHTDPYCYEGLYVEEFPVSLAGAPISNEHKPPPDLDTYM
ncbi:hypothetical protein FRC11_009384 [Ceratobasidium sp. 423]|nr:hypothetical protein FRC11_009384 [Ceratobasidium sp. 423]